MWRRWRDFLLVEQKKTQQLSLAGNESQNVFFKNKSALHHKNAARSQRGPKTVMWGIEGHLWGEYIFFFFHVSGCELHVIGQESASVLQIVHSFSSSNHGGCESLHSDESPGCVIIKSPGKQPVKSNLDHLENILVYLLYQGRMMTCMKVNILCKLHSVNLQILLLIGSVDLMLDNKMKMWGQNFSLILNICEQ